MSFKSLVAKLMKEGKSKEAATKIAGSVAHKKGAWNKGGKGYGSGPTAAMTKQTKSPAKRAMKSNQDGGDASTTEAAGQLKKLGSIARQEESRAYKKAHKAEEKTTKKALKVKKKQTEALASGKKRKIKSAKEGRLYKKRARVEEKKADAQNAAINEELRANAIKMNNQPRWPEKPKAEDVPKASKSPAKKVNSWEEEDVKIGKEQQKEGHTGHAEALFDDAHDSHNWHGGNYGRESFSTQFNNKSPMKRFKDFDQMDTWDAKATAGESPATQGKTISDGGNKRTLFGSENFYKKNWAHDQAWELHDDSADAGFLPVTPKFDDYDPGSPKYTEVKKKIADKKIKADELAANKKIEADELAADKKKTAWHTRGITPQLKSPAQKHGAMKGDQSATRPDYAGFKDTDPNYHGHDGSSHGDQSATRSDYRSRMTKNSK